jgi:hypothetical protein
VGGVWLGRSIGSEPKEAERSAPVAPADDLPAFVDVFAAGTHGRTFQLPGGGTISLSPGSTVEVAQASGGVLTLTLVQGEASVDTASGARTAALSIVAGEARLATSAGSVLRVRHDVDDIDVNVTDGSVKVTSPAGSQELGRGGVAENVPIRQRRTTSLPPEPPPQRPTLSPRASAPEPPVEPPPAAPPAPDWRSRYNAGDGLEALRILKQQSGGIDGAIASAKTPKELMDMSDLLRRKEADRDDRAAATRALTRVVEHFPKDANAQIAAYTLGKMYESMGDQALAAKYFEQARTLSPEGNLAEDSFCKRIHAEVVAGNKEEASRMAQEYVAKYPDGRCEDVEGIIAGSEAAPEEGPEEPAPPPEDASPAP